MSRRSSPIKHKYLAEERLDLLAQWSKTNLLSPSDVSCGSHIKVRWVCEKGHEWGSIDKNRVLLGSGCPYCSHRAVHPPVHKQRTGISDERMPVQLISQGYLSSRPCARIDPARSNHQKPREPKCGYFLMSALHVAGLNSCTSGSRRLSTSILKTELKLLVAII